MFTTHEVSAEGTQNGIRPFTEIQLAFLAMAGDKYPVTFPRTGAAAKMRRS